MSRRWDLANRGLARPCCQANVSGVGRPSMAKRMSCGAIASPILGPEGNREFFLHLEGPQPGAGPGWGSLPEMDATFEALALGTGGAAGA